MARGAVAKEEIINKLFEVFPNAFKIDKEIRIPVMEDGQEIQIKVALTAAKTNVYPAGATPTVQNEVSDFPMKRANNETLAPTEEEKAQVANMMAALKGMF